MRNTLTTKAQLKRDDSDENGERRVMRAEAIITMTVVVVVVVVYVVVIGYNN